MANPYFNANYYLANNPDVFAAGINTTEGAWAHYVNHGASEAVSGAAARQPAPWFDIGYYLSSNPDLATAGLTAGQLFDHFTTHGIDEGRQPNANANVNEETLAVYAAENEDLQEAFEIDLEAGITEGQYTQLAQHLYSNGYKEGRPGSPLEGGGDQNGSTFTLTQLADNLPGTAGDDLFLAPVTQNLTGSGALANTFETGDVLDGGAGRNTLEADLIASGAISDSEAPAISATTTNIQEVYFRAQSVRQDGDASNTTFGATIDAERMVGVEQWWTDNSRADIRIEDIRTRPTDTAFGMRLTDPSVSYEAYFNPLFMDGGQSSESQLVIQIAELDGGVVNTAAELANISVNSLSFELDGDAITISSDAMAEANTWEELEAAIVAALAEEGLGDLQVTRGDEGQFLLFDAEGREFSNQGGFTASATTDQQIDIRNRITQDSHTEDEKTETTLVLDGAGNGSQGGEVDLGVMSGTRGIEVIDTLVNRDSHIESLSSTSARSGTDFLEEVTLTNVGANGNVIIGDVRGNGFRDERAIDGLKDVRSVDATGMVGDVNIGVELSGFDSTLIQSYFRDLEDGEVVDFNYQGGAGDDVFTFNVSNDLASDPDFTMTINTGAGDDRINLIGNAFDLRNVSIDGGEGANTLETSSSINVGGTTNPSSFDNIQTLILAGSGTVNAGMAGQLADVENLVIATGISTNTTGYDSTITALQEGQSVSIDGKNQVVVDSNDAQQFGDIVFENAETDTLDVALDNAARANGTMTVDSLKVIGTGSEVRTVNLSSNGARDTSNTVTAIDAAAVTTLNLLGSQDLEANVVDLASAPVTNGQSPALSVDASELTGDLTLGIDAGLLVKDSTDKLVGTAGDNDELLFYGIFGLDGSGNAKASTNISEFETVTFGMAAGVQGRFDASNTTGVELYEIANLSNNLTVDGLRGTENVLISHTGNQNLALTAGAKATSNTLNAEVVTDAVGSSFGGDLFVDDYRTINLELNNASDPQTKVSFSPDLVLNGFGDGATATVADINNGDAGSNYARELNLTGGRDGQNTYTGGVSNDAADTLTLHGLTNSLTSIDVSGFKGEFVGSFARATDSSGTTFANADVLKALNTNTTITVGEYEFSWNNNASRDTANSDFAVTTFKFTEDAYTDGVVWQIDAFLQDSGNSQNLDVLDLRGLGIEGVSQLNIEYGDWDGTNFSLTGTNGGYADNTGDPTDTTDAVRITHNGDMDFEILLTGLDTSIANGLEPGANFMFA